MAEIQITEEQVIEYLSTRNVMELSALVKKLEEKWGVSAAAPVAVSAVTPAAGAATAAAQEEKTEFTVVLESYPADKKIGVIKVVREITGLGLKEAKDLVDAVPKPIKEGANKAEAENIKKKLEEAGAKVTVK
ncbi:MAG: 50S ribosomal protein L7/L12 [Deltaproteobacteria bacterium]|nr:50S ribosomal protein L7/L12 [Deltaproteobacteria bacterium]